MVKFELDKQMEKDAFHLFMTVEQRKNSEHRIHVSNVWFPMGTHGHPQYSFVFGSWKDEKNLSLNVLYFHTKFCSIGCFPYGGLLKFP